MTHMTPEAFETLPIPRKDLPQLGTRYRVYKDPENFILVEAASALEALKACGMEPVHRIERDTIHLNNVLNVQALAEAPAAAAPPTAETPAATATPPPTAETPAAAPPPAATPPADAAPLSPEDVNKLLQNQ